MRMTNIYRLNEVLHRLIKKKHKGNKNIQQIDRTFTFIILKLKISFLRKTKTIFSVIIIQVVGRGEKNKKDKINH